MDDLLGGSFVQDDSGSQESGLGHILILGLDGQTDGLDHILDAGLDGAITVATFQALTVSLDSGLVISQNSFLLETLSL